MIIKIIPETDAEKARMNEVEHIGINEFFIFGQKKDGDGDAINFHDWNGSFRYLSSNLHYFQTVMEQDQLIKASSKRENQFNREHPQIIPMDMPNASSKKPKIEFSQKEIDKLSNDANRLIKRSSPDCQSPNDISIVEVENQDKLLKFPQQ